MCALLGGSLLGCYYDHSFTQELMERRRQAKQAEGATIATRTNAQPIRFHGRIKLYVAEDYRQQHGSWKEPLLDLVDEANAVLGLAFGLRLEVSGALPWTPRCNSAQLDSCLHELEQLDPGEPGEWVVGVLGALPRFSASFDELGMARLPGRHFLVRDVSDLIERQAIDQAFASMLESRRDEIYRRRKHHKRLAIFLHEWGHTLGAPHTAENEGLLYPSYDDQMSSYSEDSAALIAKALPARFESGNESAAVARAAPEPKPSGVSPSARAAAPSTRTDLAQLSSADQTLYLRAEAVSQDNDPEGAITLLAPLVDRYPSSYSVQHMACGLLMQLGRSADVQTVCGRVMQLSTNK